NKRWRIEIPVQQGPGGEDFDTTDIKSNESVILRELRIKRSDMGARQSDVARYESNTKRLGGMKSEGKKVLLDSFKVETKNSICFYQVFDADAWAMLGEELYLGGGDAPAEDEDLPPIEGRDLDPELAAMLAKLPSSGDDKKKKGGSTALATTDDKLPVKASGDGAVASRAKIVIGVSVLVLIIAGVLAALFVL